MKKESVLIALGIFIVLVSAAPVGAIIQPTVGRYDDSNVNHSGVNFNPKEFVLGKKTPWKKHFLSELDSPKKEFVSNSSGLIEIFNTWMDTSVSDITALRDAVSLEKMPREARRQLVRGLIRFFRNVDKKREKLFKSFKNGPEPNGSGSLASDEAN